MNTPDKHNNLEELILQELDGDCADFELLNEHLASDPELMDHYLDFISLCAVLSPEVAIDIPEDNSFDIECDQLSELCAALAEEENNAESTEIYSEIRELACPVATGSGRSGGFRQKVCNLPYYSTLFLIAVMLLGISYVYTHPRHIPQDVATVVDTYMVKWGHAEHDLGFGDRIFDDSEIHHLLRGVLKIQFDNGATIVVEAPAKFAIEDNDKMRVKFGKLSTYVPKQAVGFRVNTPGCSIIDLGTEFGIDVSVRGETSVHMFKGRASVVTATDGQVHQGQVLEASEARKITVTGKVSNTEFRERDFVRNFASREAIIWSGQDLSLASIASGANGIEPAKENYGIDPITGALKYGNEEDRVKLPDGSEIDRYITVSKLDFVDGIFSPDGEYGPVQINSAGDTYDGFGNTDGMSYMTIGAHKIVHMFTASAGRILKAMYLEGCEGSNYENLCLHANSGITFDLKKIREAMPFVDIKRFSSLYGIPSGLGDDITADFYVFVDGQARMIKREVSDTDKPGRVEVEISDTDRFLTLVCTEGENNFGDWTLFVNPRLELEESSSH